MNEVTSHAGDIAASVAITRGSGSHGATSCRSRPSVARLAIALASEPVWTTTRVPAPRVRTVVSVVVDHGWVTGDAAATGSPRIGSSQRQRLPEVVASLTGPTMPGPSLPVEAYDPGMQVRLAYGTTGMRVDLPDEVTTVVRPVHRPAAEDPLATVRTALRAPVGGPPLRAIARRGQRVAISVCDITRPQPRPVMLRAILDELDGIVAPADVTILVATGTHRRSSDAELDAMLGADIRARCRVLDHDARDRSAHVDLGVVDDVPVLIDRTWVDADLRITTGFVEPHFFAGFSGGPKMVAPGLAGLDTTLALHDARRIGDPKATWGVCEGNPVHDAIRAVAATALPQFSVDVLLNDEQAITAAFGGPLFEMHREARATARREAMVRVDAPFDVVVTSNSGYPLDQNLYQAVKGMSAAAEVVRDGGTIICAAECRDGLPEHGAYADLLAQRSTPAGLLALIATSPVTIPDQWQVQIQARVQGRARVLVRTDGLTPGQLRRAHLEAVDDIGGLVRDLVRGRQDARVCVLPEGPQTIAYLG